MTMTEVPSLSARLVVGESQATAVEQARAIAEVQAAVVVAQSCPRNIERAIADMQDTCGRLALAERATYTVKNRGDDKPSVYLARELARVWGNIDYGVRELRRDDTNGVSEVLAFAWDQQTNTRSSRSFIVPHERMKSGKRIPLTDLTDVYLNNQNIGARAVRECIFTVLPDWFVQDAKDKCRVTVENGEGVPLAERRERMVVSFAEMGVTQAQLETWLHKPRDSWAARDVAAGVVAYRSIQSGDASKDELFPPPRVTASEILGGSEPSGGDPASLAVPVSAPDGGAPPEDVSADGATFGEVGASSAEAITGPQMKKLHALLNETGYDNRDEALAFLSSVVGRDIDTSKALSKDEASACIEALLRLTPPDDAEPGDDEKDGGE